jgi:hypothetical protein
VHTQFMQNVKCLQSAFINVQHQNVWLVCVNELQRSFDTKNVGTWLLFMFIRNVKS